MGSFDRNSGDPEPDKSDTEQSGDESEADQSEADESEADQSQGEEEATQQNDAQARRTTRLVPKELASFRRRHIQMIALSKATLASRN